MVRRLFVVRSTGRLRMFLFYIMIPIEPINLDQRFNEEIRLVCTAQICS